jgi:Na+/proline symporter
MRVGGLGRLIAKSPAGFFSLLNPANAEKGWGYLAVFVVLVLLSYNSTWSLIQRSCCVKNERAARKASVLAAVLYFVTPPLWILPSICARQILPGVAGGESFVLLCKEVLPAGFLGIVLAGMFSATMSSLSSDYNIFAGVITQDIYRRLIDPRASQRRLLWVGRISLLAVGAVAVAIAIAVLVTKTGLFDGMVKNFGIALPPMAVPLLGGLIYRRTSAAGAVATYLAGLTTALVLHFGFGATAQAVTGWNIVVSVAVFFGWGLVLPRRSAAEEARVRALFEHVRRPVPPAEVAAIERRAAAGPSPFAITGVVLCGIGGLLGLLGLAPMRWEARLTNWVLAAVLIVLGLLGLRLRTRTGNAEAKGVHELHEFHE